MLIKLQIIYFSIVTFVSGEIIIENVKSNWLNTILKSITDDDDINDINDK